jgi:O-acetyl-ADP-ribose deacetylase (regulator of RNase III)
LKQDFGRWSLELLDGDITKVPADAIANAANSALAGGGGVDGAIHRAGGPSIMHQLDAIRAEQGGCPTGSAVATTAGRLPAQYVFHAVGPVWHGGDRGEPELLASCYRTCLRLAEERSVKRISFPSISTGVYGYPIESAAGVALHAVVEHFRAPEAAVREVLFVLFGQPAYQAYEKQLKTIANEH